MKRSKNPAPAPQSLISWNRPQKTDEHTSEMTSKCGRFTITRSAWVGVKVWLEVDGQTAKRHGDQGKDMQYGTVANAKAAAERVARGE